MTAHDGQSPHDGEETDCLTCEIETAIKIAVEDWNRRHDAPHVMDLIGALGSLAGMFTAEACRANPGEERRAIDMARAMIDSAMTARVVADMSIALARTPGAALQ